MSACCWQSNLKFAFRIRLAVRSQLSELLVGQYLFLVIRILFIDNESSAQGSDILKFDTKKSGDYVICSAKHAFESFYTTTLLCGRLGSLEEDFAL